MKLTTKNSNNDAKNKSNNSVAKTSVVDIGGSVVNDAVDTSENDLEVEIVDISLEEVDNRYGFIEYFYDFQGISGMSRNGRNYFFVRDVFGNIVEIINDAGTLVARYSYDAWGNTVVLNPNGTVNTNSNFIGNINPFRYRGYYMDRGTGFYYLQTRFYDPVIRRFINADNYMLVPLLATQQGGLNMHAYALNNPVMNLDSTGQFVITGAILIKAAIIGAVVGGIIGGTAGAVTAHVNGQNVWAGFGIGFGFGALAGAGAGIGGVFMGALAGVKAGTITLGAALKSVGFGTSIAFTTGVVSGFGEHLAFQRLGNPGVVLDGQAAARAGLIRGGFNVLGAGLGHVLGINDAIFDSIAGLSLDIFFELFSSIWENAPNKNMPLLARYS